MPRPYKRLKTPVIGESMAKQSFKDECNINNIMAKFHKTGVIDHYAAYAPQYGEVPKGDLLEAMQIVAEAEEMFADLPSGVRKRFGNDPAEFLEFMEDPKNREEAVKLDLVNGREEIPEPQKRRPGDVSKITEKKTEENKAEV